MKISKDPTFTHDVPVRTPVDGGFRDEKLKTTYAVIPVDEVRGFDLKSAEGTDGFLERAVRSFSDLTGDDDKPLSYNDEVRAFLLKQPHVRQALCVGYFDAVSGAATGN